MSDSQLDENQRRYYLDAMGIQCWQLLESPQQLKMPEVAEQQGDAGNVHKSKKREGLARGNTSAGMMFVLLSPSSNDEVAGELCSGEEGALLTKMLAAINVSIADVYITSLLKHNAPAGCVIAPDDIKQCNTYLKQQVQKVKPEMLIVLGEAAAQLLLKQNTSLDTLRKQVNLADSNEDTSGNAVTHFESIPLCVSYSPAELLQNTENKRKAWLDLQQLQKQLSR